LTCTKARQHRIGGCQDRPDQHRDTPAQTEHVVAEQGDATDAGEHHRPGQYIGALPRRMPQRHAQLETADEQRDQHGDFGEVFHPAGDMQEFHLPQADAELADEHAETEADQGRSDWQPAQEGRGEGEDQQQDAEHGHPFEKIHACSDGGARCCAQGCVPLERWPAAGFADRAEVGRRRSGQRPVFYWRSSATISKARWRSAVS